MKLLKKKAQCPCCDDPASTRMQRSRCRKAGCPVPPKVKGRKASTVAVQKELRKARNKRYKESLKEQKEGANFEKQVQAAFNLNYLNKREVTELLEKEASATNPLGYEIELPVKYWLPSYLPKEDSEEEEPSYWTKEQLQQVVPERRFGKKCKRCWRKGQGLKVSHLLKHEEFCFAPDSDV